MFKTDASIRRFIKSQESLFPDAPPKLVDRYNIYVWCVARDEYQKTFKQWLNDRITPQQIGRTMFKTEASIRRFLKSQERDDYQILQLHHGTYGIANLTKQKHLKVDEKIYFRTSYLQEAEAVKHNLDTSEYIDLGFKGIRHKREREKCL